MICVFSLGHSAPLVALNKRLRFALHDYIKIANPYSQAVVAIFIESSNISIYKAEHATVGDTGKVEIDDGIDKGIFNPSTDVVVNHTKWPK